MPPSAFCVVSLSAPVVFSVMEREGGREER